MELAEKLDGGVARKLAEDGDVGRCCHGTKVACSGGRPLELDRHDVAAGRPMNLVGGGGDPADRCRATTRGAGDAVELEGRFGSGRIGFASPSMVRGTYRYRFTRPGVYRLFCSLHPTLMSETVRVTAPMIR